jgi:hypothetical protein
VGSGLKSPSKATAYRCILAQAGKTGNAERMFICVILSGYPPFISLAEGRGPQLVSPLEIAGLVGDAHLNGIRALFREVRISKVLTV